MSKSVRVVSHGSSAKPSTTAAATNSTNPASTIKSRIGAVSSSSGAAGASSSSNVTLKPAISQTISRDPQAVSATSAPDPALIAQNEERGLNYLKMEESLAAIDADEATSLAQVDGEAERGSHLVDKMLALIDECWQSLLKYNTLVSQQEAKGSISEAADQTQNPELKVLRSHLLQLKNEVLLQVMTMRSLSRLSQYRLKAVRERTQEERLRVDQRARDLQNLQYELSHLEGQISRCLEFRSKDERIPLVPLDTFYALAPPEVAKKEFTQSDLHMQRLARLEFEFLQRKNLAAELKSVRGRCEEMQNEIEEKRRKLNSINPMLLSIIEASKPAQEFLNMHISRDVEQQKLVRLLPPSLYSVYFNLSTLASLYPSWFSVEIDGDLEIVKAWLECGYVEKIEQEMEHELKVLSKADAAARASRARAAIAKANASLELVEHSVRPPSPDLPPLELFDERLAALEQLAGVCDSVSGSSSAQKRKKNASPRDAKRARTSSLLELEDSEPTATESETDEADAHVTASASGILKKVSPLAAASGAKSDASKTAMTSTKARKPSGDPRRSGARPSPASSGKTTHHTGVETADSSETERSIASSSALSLNRLFVPHSLAVLLKCKFGTLSVTLRFEYQLALKVVTVKLLDMENKMLRSLYDALRASATCSASVSSSAMDVDSPAASSDADARVVLKDNDAAALSWISKNVLGADSVLSGLLDADDTGLDSPNSKHRLLFTKAKTGGFKESSVRNKHGIPYAWLQQVAGFALAAEPSRRRISSSSSSPANKSAAGGAGTSSSALSPGLSCSMRSNSSRVSISHATAAGSNSDDAVLEAQDFTERVLFAIHGRISHLLWLSEQLALLSTVPDARNLYRLYKRLASLPSKCGPILIPEISSADSIEHVHLEGWRFGSFSSLSYKSLADLPFTKYLLRGALGSELKRTSVFGQLRLKREATVCDCCVELDLFLVLPRAPPEDVRPIGVAAQLFVRIRLRRSDPAAGEEQHTSATNMQLFELERQLNLQLPLEYARTADSRCAARKTAAESVSGSSASASASVPSQPTPAIALAYEDTRCLFIVHQVLTAIAGVEIYLQSLVAERELSDPSKGSAARCLLPELKPVRPHAGPTRSLPSHVLPGLGLLVYDNSEI